jgi:hypothetical protein
MRLSPRSERLGLGIHKVPKAALKGFKGERISIDHGVKGSMKAPIVRVQGWKALTASNRRTVGRWVPRESEVSLWSRGVGEQERSLTGDATAMRCADTFHPRRNLQRRSRTAWGDGCGSRQRDATGERSVSLAKMCETQTQFVVTHTSCSRR